MRLLVTGADGQLGHELRATLGHHDLLACGRPDLDVTDREAVRALVRAERPDVVVNAAAWTAVDDCEADPARALLVNGTAVAHLVEAVAETGGRVLQVSTDYVFDGRLDRPYVETDEPNPLSVYGHSKLVGEQATRPEDTVVRTSWVCGRHGPSMVGTILRLAGTHPTLHFVSDQVGHPTLAADLATMITRLVEEARPGLFHVTNQGPVSWYEFAREVMEAAGHDPDRVRPVTTAELDPPRPAVRPANSVLDNAALRAAGIPLLPHHREPLRRLVADLTAA